MALIASSTSVPMVGCGALAFRCCQRASGGTQKMLTARYSSGSSGSAPLACWATKFRLLFLESVGDVFEEDQAKENVLILRGIHAAAERAGHLPQLGFVAHGSSGVLCCGGGPLLWARHASLLPGRWVG